MTDSICCPDQLLLQSFLSGRLNELEAEPVARHLEGCHSCLEWLTQAAVTDPLLRDLRASSASGGAPAIPGRLRDFMQSLKQLIASSHEDTAKQSRADPLALVSAGRSTNSTAGRVRADTATPVLADTVGLTDGPAELKLTAGEHLGRYHLREQIGKGGMGTVYRAHDPQLDRIVAVKVPQFQGPPDAQQRARQRFVREARAAAPLRHAHICPIYDVGEQEGRPYVVMAFVEGQSLAERLHDRGAFADCRQAVDVVLQVAQALEAVHARGIIHRDLKPANILLDQAGNAILTDFGLARREDEGERLTVEGSIVGTPAYMAPEQVSPRLGTVGFATDLYSLGVVLYELLTGRTPFQGSRIELLTQIATEELPPPARFRSDLDPELEGIVLQAMSRQPEGRFPSARQFAAILQAWLVKANRAAGGHDLVVSNSGAAPACWAPSSSAASLPVARRWPVGLRGTWLAGGLLTMLALAALGYFAGGAWRTTQHRPHLTVPGVTDQTETFTGWIDVRVWEPGNGRRHGLALRQPGALPLQAGDQIRIEAELNRPGFLYVLWLDTEGKVWPLYPWQPGKWGGRPVPEQPLSRLNLPEEADRGWPMNACPPGMETLVLLVREQPLPADVDLAGLMTGLPAQKAQSLKAAVWFENGAVLGKEQEPDRAPNFFDPQQLDDPVLRTQRLLKEKVLPLFSYSRVVSFANSGK